jgi:hypothetical protein
MKSALYTLTFQKAKVNFTAVNEISKFQPNTISVPDSLKFLSKEPTTKGGDKIFLTVNNNSNLVPSIRVTSSVFKHR